jgi:hypothetical protein
MRLHEDSRLFRQAVLATAQEMQLPEVYVEKDYWVTVKFGMIRKTAHSYSGEFRNLVYGVLPAPDLMAATLCRIRDRMRAFDWI